MFVSGTTATAADGSIVGKVALNRSVSHFQGHTQEIFCLTRMRLKNAYQFAWVPLSYEQGAP